MRPCTRVGIDTTWRCNWRCRHCFYVRNPHFHSGDLPLAPITAKIDKAREGGLDHVVFVGYGEPSLGGTTPHLIDYAHERGMAVSIITNGATGLHRFQGFVRQGIDHFHISSHGLDGTLDTIVETPGAFAKQAELKEWLAAEEVPFRTNVTMQLGNFRELPDLAEYEISRGVWHFVFLGFLPHYEWHDHVDEIAVHPAELRPYIEAGADRLIEAGVHFTIRYHPLCHLRPDLWKYVVNARHVSFDPWEWNYDLQVHDLERLWQHSVGLGEGVACKEPCSQCSAYRHCGGWNRVNAAAFGGAELAPIQEVPARYAEVWDSEGGLHDLNPVNRLSGTICEKTSATHYM